MSGSVSPVEARPIHDLELAVNVLREGQVSHVFVRGGRVVASGAGHGVLPLIATIERAGPAALSGCALADKVVGRAALLAALACGVVAVHGEFMSETAIEETGRRHVPFTYGVAIPRVLNRSGTDLCPFEALVGDVSEPGEALERLRKALSQAQAGMADRPPPATSRRNPRPALRPLAQGGGWIALGILLPLLLHPIGVGPVFLPMHLPVLVGAALSGPVVGALAGGVVPLLSHLLTGMPPMVPPVAALMSVELAATGLVAGWLRERWFRVARPVAFEYLWLGVAVAAGRLALGLSAVTVGPSLGLQVPALAYVKGALLSGLPGLALQFALVPVLLRQLARRRA